MTNQMETPSYPAHTRKTREAAKTPAKRYTVAEALEEAGDRVALRAGRMSPKELRERQAERAQAIADDAANDGTTRPGATDQYSGMEYAELQQTAKERGLNAGGSTLDLQARLRDADAQAATGGNQS
jgi:hypothetical protein